MSTTDIEMSSSQDEKLPGSSTPQDNVLAEYGPVPDGGVRAWMVALGAACISFSCLGFSNSFGVFAQYYQTHQLIGEPANKIAWIGSISLFMQFAGGVIAGPLFDRYGAWVIRPGAIVYVLAMMLTSLCTQYWHFMLCQGVLMGLAMSTLQIPSFAAVTQYFDKKRGAALGLVIAGSSVGGVVFPIALSKMLNASSIGFGWSVRIMGFVITPLMLFACFAVRPRLPPRKTDFFLPSAFRNKRYLFLIAALFFSFFGFATPLFFLPKYAVSRGMDTTLASYLLAIVNGASTFGRIIPGILADKYGKINTFALGSFFTGIIILTTNSVTNTAGLIAYSIAFGFASGTIISGGSAAFSICTDDARNMGTYLGMGFAIGSIAALIGPPINGALVDRYGGFEQLSILSGVMCLVATVAGYTAKAFTKEGLWGKV
ncbi:major facilitator superfamily domain-containing protein [Echria macrotheca]|uniref:Major facilitator superfamily domain-containing protein n=1 Tax=Echria macrotheca TaxID=438768 RepID=A0AAJ0BJE6_9PEZI|nr:major facilitator superfamily domain-containing protein [Echria macrotheca]